MKSETAAELKKAQACLANAQVALSVNLSNDAGRNAYFVEFHCAKALLFERDGNVTKTHGGVHREFSRIAVEIPSLAELLTVLNENYYMKSVADYETGPDSTLTLDVAAESIEVAKRFMDAVLAVIGA